MNNDDKPRVYLLAGTAFLAVIALTSVFFIAGLTQGQGEAVFALTCSLGVLVFNSVLLASSANRPPLLRMGRALLWLGFVGLVIACSLATRFVEI